MIECFDVTLPNGITLSCRASGPHDAPRLVFLHGFPEAAFVWDDLLDRFGSGWRCIAPNLRGYERSSAPVGVESYRAKHLIADIAALIEHVGAPVEAVVAHDWGGALAWVLAAQRPELLKRLVIINAPHPGLFLRELRDNPAQQQASAYITFLCRPDAAELLAEDDFRRLWRFFLDWSDGSQPDGGWLDEPTMERYRSVWRCGLEGPLDYYRASALRPPLDPNDPIMTLDLPAAMLHVARPTLVIWAEGDAALPSSLLDGLDAYVPNMRTVRVPGASHWIVHEQPDLVAMEIERELAP